MKKLFVVIFSFLILFAVAKPVSAQMRMMGTRDGDTTNLDSVVDDILKSQNITSTKDIDCSKVTNDQFEKLGDGWMDYQIGNEAVHERMDNMMGGEGSDQLRNAHVQTGKNYLGCSTNGNYYGMPMMYGYGSNSVQNWDGMMGYGTNTAGRGANAMFAGYGPGFSGIRTVLVTVTWIASILFLLAGTRYFWKNVKK